MKNIDNEYTFTIAERNPAHITIRLHVNHALAGTLVLRTEEYQHFAEALNPTKIFNV